MGKVLHPESLVQVHSGPFSTNFVTSCFSTTVTVSITVFGFPVVDIPYAITTLEPRYETVVNTVTVVEKHEVVKFVEKGPESICMKISGCKIVHDATTEKEYCPTCIMK